MNISAKNIIWSAISVAFGIIFISIVVLILFTVGEKGYQFGNSVFREEAIATGAPVEVLVEIKSGMSDYDVAKYMKEKGLVKDENVFFTQIILSDYRKKYVAGEYMLNTGMLPTEILETICSGEFYVEPEAPETETGSESATEKEGASQ